MSMEMVPEQIDAKMVVYIEGYAAVAEFPLQIAKQDLADGYYFDFETSTTAHNGLQSAVQAQCDDKFISPFGSHFNGRVVFKIGIVHKGLLVEALRLEKGKFLPACWFCVKKFAFLGNMQNSSLREDQQKQSSAKRFYCKTQP